MRKSHERSRVVDTSWNSLTLCRNPALGRMDTLAIKLSRYLSENYFKIFVYF